MNIPIATAKAVREMLEATHLVIFTISDDGTQQVATHGLTEGNAREAAIAGNNLKSALGWPESLCKASPLPRECKNCTYYKPDYGIHCFNGWSGDGSSGWCQLEPARVKVDGRDKCSHFEPNA